ncbi:MAG TPA: RDD family protein [Alphaproteobacteria bacterium]|nr:RDD family protein [Alphaproteobacteria bacterium]
MMRQRQPRRRPGSTLPALRLGDGEGEAGQNRRAHDESANRDAGPDRSAHGAGMDAANGGAFSDPAFVSDIVFKRILAHIVDTAILLAIMAPLGFFMIVTAVATFGLLILPFALAFLALRFLYYVGFTASARSATPGMRMLGIELRTIAGGRPDLLQAFLRLAVYYVLAGLLTPLILLAALFNVQRRALHDLVSETVVVNRLARLAF